MDASVEQPVFYPGLDVIDTVGIRVGVVRHAYPHFLAVENMVDPPEAYRVPYRAIASYDAQRILLNVPKDVLDPITPEVGMAVGEIAGGGVAPVGTGTPLSEPAAGFGFDQRMIGDGEPGRRTPEEIGALESALADANVDSRPAPPHQRDNDPAEADTGASYGTDAGN